MGRPKKIEKEVETPILATADVVKEPEVKKEVEVKSKVTSVSVFHRNGSVLRTYTLEAHGADFIGLAKEYAKKVSGNVL